MSDTHAKFISFQLLMDVGLYRKSHSNNDSADNLSYLPKNDRWVGSMMSTVLLHPSGFGEIFPTYMG
jgi:hypothetical protein